MKPFAFDGGTAPAGRGGDDVGKQAIAWYVRLCSGDATDADHARWRQWHAEHPAHEAAWNRIESIRSTLQRAPAHVALPALQSAGRNRRQVLRSVLLLASAGAAGYLSYRVVDAPGARGLLADLRTGTGERRALVLVDGSQLTLNTRTGVDVVFDAQRRLLRLGAGEILVRTARGEGPRDPRPFLVETGEGTVTALGTRFSVRTGGGRTAVSVFEHAVALRPVDVRGEPVILRAGEQASFARDGVGAVEAGDADAAAWEHGSLVANDRRLGDVVAELARYRPGHLSCAPSVADLRISGAFPLDDTDRALAVIARALPVRVARTTRYWVTVGPNA